MVILLFPFVLPKGYWVKSNAVKQFQSEFASKKNKDQPVSTDILISCFTFLKVSILSRYQSFCHMYSHDLYIVTAIIPDLLYFSHTSAVSAGRDSLPSSSWLESVAFSIQHPLIKPKDLEVPHSKIETLMETFSLGAVEYLTSMVLNTRKLKNHQALVPLD